MNSKAVFTMKLEPELRDEFMAAAKEDDRPASQIVRELMRGYLEQRLEARDYDTYLRQKVAAARISSRLEQGRWNDEIEATFAARRHQAIAEQV